MAKALANAYHNLSVMLDAGVAIKRCFEAASASVKGKQYAAFNSIAKQVMQGSTIHEAMAAHPDVFEPMDIMIMEAGEQSGRLAECVKQLSAWHQFVDRMKKVIRSGMVLPIFLLHIAAVFAPIPSIALGSATLSGAISQAISILLVFYVPFTLTILIIKFAPQESPARAMLDSITMRIPVLKTALLNLALARFTRTFTTLYAAGVPITTCADKAVKMTGNEKVRQMLGNVYDNIYAGKEMWTGFSDKLPPELVESWQVGEESGQLDTVTQRLARIYEEKTELNFVALSTWLPRIAYLIVSLIIIRAIFKGFQAIYGSILNM